MIRIYTENDHDAPSLILSNDEFHFGILVADNKEDEVLAEQIAFEKFNSQDLQRTNLNGESHTGYWIAIDKERSD